MIHGEINGSGVQKRLKMRKKMPFVGVFRRGDLAVSRWW